MSADLVHLLVRANLAGSAAILLVLLIAPPLRRAAGAEAAYRLWLLPPLAAVASLIPFPQGASMLPPIVFEAPRLWSAPVAAASAPLWPGLIALAWALGAGAFAAVLAVQQGRFVAGLGVLVPAHLGGRKVMRGARNNAGPAVVGADIVIPADFETRFTPEEQSAILAHEAQHLARGDVAANAVTALIQCLCWFNPVVHLAARRARLDQELACDAAVIEARPALRRPYAEALLKTQILAQVPPIGCAWPARAQHPLKERIAMLKSPPPTASRRAAGAVLIAALALGAGYAAWAAQPGAVIVKPDWIERPTGADLARFYPAEAVRAKAPGEAVMQCRVETSGLLAGCTVLRQAPEGAGFGDAALQIAPLFRMKPMTRNGAPVAGALVRIPIKFAIAAGGPPA